MDFELEQHKILCYETLGRASVCQEETLEAIVPDACPDILRIADVCAQAYPKRWEAGEGQVMLFGEIRAVVLYIPEEGNGLRHLELKLPYTCQADMEQVTSESILEVNTHLRCADGRMLNPRKVLLRADISAEITAFGRKELCICSGVLGPGPEQVCQQQTGMEFERLVSVPQRTFSISEELRLTGTQPPTLMACRASCLCDQSRVIGSKLVFKGKSDVIMLLQNPDGTLEHRTETFPFSQILEAKGVGEAGDCFVTPEVAELMLVQSEDDPYRVSVEMEILAQGQIRQTEKLMLLTDMYSISHHVLPQEEKLVLPAPGELQLMPQTLRDFLETSDTVRSVCDCRFHPGELLCAVKEGYNVFTLPGQIVVLYLDEERQLRRREKNVELSVRIPYTPDVETMCRCLCAQEVFAAPCAGGIEVRINVEFQLRSAKMQTMYMVNRAQLGETRDTNTSRPSIVLRRAEPGEGLWDMAKSCGTTKERIMQANELTDEEIAAGTMLLIPSAR